MNIYMKKAESRSKKKSGRYCRYPEERGTEKAAASQTDPLKPEGGNLSVVVRTKYGYHYLYFPDDGSNTERHEGNQQFMFKGAEGVADEVVNGIIDKLVNRLEEL